MVFISNLLTKNLHKIKTALISVSNKDGIEDFCKILESDYNIKIFATGGTYTTLKNSNVNINKLDDIVQYPEMLDGRVKTLQPEIFAGILAKRIPSHLKQLNTHNIDTIDLIVCNFYPFEKHVLNKNIELKNLIELIDIGGPSLVRAAAKNYEYVTVIPSNNYYDYVIEQLQLHDGSIPLKVRENLAQIAFGMVANYDIAIYNGLNQYNNSLFPDNVFISAKKFDSISTQDHKLEKKSNLKYGENPQQSASIYNIIGCNNMTNWEQLSGDIKSFNNYLDIGNAVKILSGFDSNPTVVTVKHGQISGFAFAPDISEAYTLAHNCDPQADFGGIVVLNREVDVNCANLIGKNPNTTDSSVYTEIILAPNYSKEAINILKAKQKNKIKLIKTTNNINYPFDVRILEGNLLVQGVENYNLKLDPKKITYPTINKPNSKILNLLLTAWELVRKVESNGIVIGDGKFSNNKLTHFWTYGIGTFRKRSGAVKIALDNSGSRSKNAVAASDGFFPFRDGIDLLGKAGITGVIQPGGSIRDPETIAAANEHNMSMIFTHERAFTH